MLVQLQIEDSQSKFFIDLITKLDNVVNNITYIEENNITDKKDTIFMKYQEENGFSKNVLAQESEDVWNDI